MICPHGHDEGVIERLATPEEVDAGNELGIAFDPCPECAQARVLPACDPSHWDYDSGGNDLPDTLLGVPDYDHQAEQGQGPPA